MPNLMHDPEHADYCAGCYEVDEGIFFHPPRNGGPLSLRQAAPIIPDDGLIFVKLTQFDYQEAERCARMRMRRAKKKNSKGTNNQPLDQIPKDNLLGCITELAVCRWRGMPISAMDFYPDNLRFESGDKKPSDFGRIDVKAKSKTGEYLLIQKDDPREYLYVLTSAGIGDLEVVIHGWIEGADAMKEEYFGDEKGTRRPCYWIPVSTKDKDKKNVKLNSMLTLPEEAWGKWRKIK